MNLPVQRSTLQQEISALTSQLAPAKDDEIERCLSGLMDGGMMFPASIMASDKVAEYRKVLVSVPVSGLRAAFVKLKRGEYENLNMAFIPLPAEFAAMARAEARNDRENLLRLKEKARAIEEQSAPPEKRNPEMIARIRAALNNYRAEHAASKAVSMVPQEPISDEKAEYYRKIMTLRDASDVSVEQSAYRRSIAAQLPDQRKEAAE